MPVIWWIPFPLPRLQILPTVTRQIDQDLTVTAPTVKFDPIRQTQTFSGGVIAKYDVDTIHCDFLEVRLSPSDRSATAKGHVALDDPDAHVLADELNFTWQPDHRHATAKNVSIQLERTVISAASADLTPVRWELTDVRGTPDKRNPPDLQLRTHKVVVYPGKKATLSHPQLWLFGRHVLTLPDRTINLDPRTQGVTFPSISYQRDHGVGASWQVGQLLDDRTNIFAGASAYPRETPSAVILATRTFVPMTRSSAVISPSSEFGERFRFGYLESVVNETPEQETRFLSEPRNSLSIGSTLNAGIRTMHATDSITKPMELVYESGGIIGKDHAESGSRRENLAGFGQVRLQEIRSESVSYRGRALLFGSLELPSVQLGAHLATLTRVDMNLFLGSVRYGWERLSSGLVFDPIKQLRLSGALVGSVEEGTPQFDFDRLEDRNGMHLRADVDLGATKLSYLLKYDTSFKWFDREYMVTQVVGSFEPYVLYRRYPQTYTIGVRLRLQDLSDLLSRRQFKRRASVPYHPAQP